VTIFDELDVPNEWKPWAAYLSDTVVRRTDELVAQAEEMVARIGRDQGSDRADVYEWSVAHVAVPPARPRGDGTTSDTQAWLMREVDRKLAKADSSLRVLVLRYFLARGH